MIRLDLFFVCINPLGQRCHLDNDATWTVMPLGQTVTWAMWAFAMVAWAKKAVGKSGSIDKSSEASFMMKISISLHKPNNSFQK